MRIVITGASGHIGNNLVRYLETREEGVEIIALTRRTIERELDGTRAKQVVGDLFDEAFLLDTIREGDIVVHLAGFIDLTDKRKEQTYKVNYHLTKLLLDVCKKRGVRFLYAGSVDAIDKSGTGKIAEPSEYDEKKIEGNYGKSKALAMGLVWTEIQNNPDFNGAMVIPSAVVGAHDYKPSAVGKVLLDILKGKCEFGVNGGYNFVGVRDICHGIYALIKNGKRGQYILSGENVSVKELYEIVNREKGYRRKPIILPIWFVKLFVPFLKVLSKITLKTLCEPHDYSCELAKKELGYSPAPAREAILEALTWIENNLL